MSTTLSPTPVQINSSRYARNTVPVVTVTTSESEMIRARLYLHGENSPLYTASYTPDFDGKAYIDLRGVYDDYLATVMPTGNVTAQADGVKQFDLVVDGSSSGALATYTFYVANSLLSSPESFGEFAAGHFLTNQPTEKITDLDSPEYLTWYDHQGDWYVSVRFYLKAGGYEDHVLHTDTAEGIFTMDVSYSELIKVSSVLPADLLGYYDVIAFNSKDTELARQRYIYFERTGREKCFLFVNALGGIDTMVCQGANTLQPETTHHIGRFSDTFRALDDTDDVRRWNQTTGPMPWSWRDWIHEILTAKQGAALHIPSNGSRLAIVVTSSDISMADSGQLGSASFTYMLSSTANIVSQNEHDTTLHASVASEAEEMDDVTEKETMDWEEGETGFYTEIADVPSDKLYISFDPTETAVIYVLINGTLATEIQCGTARIPVVIETQPGDTVTFETQDTPVGSLTVNYYIDEEYTSQNESAQEETES